MNSTPHRILFVSHDHRGLGHTRRTIATCRGILEAFEAASALLVTGSHDVSLSNVPPRADYIELPSIKKRADGTYSGRLSRSVEEIEAFRGRILRDAMRWFRPTIVMVDSLPPRSRGAGTLEALAYLRRIQPRAVRILLLRDILNPPEVVKRQWDEQDAAREMRDRYDRILIYGQAEIFDALREYDVPADIRERSKYVGYLPHVADQARVATLKRRWCPEQERVLLAMVGGGSDGQPVLDAVIGALPAIAARWPVRAVILPGPECPADVVRSLERDERLLVIGRCDDTVNHIAAADVVVSMAGFNSVNEIVALQRQAVVCPRSGLDTEQQMRAEKFSSLGLLEWIPRERLTGKALAEAILGCLESPKARPFERVRLTAIEEICATLATDALVKSAFS